MTAANTSVSFFPAPTEPLKVIAHRGGSLEAPENTLSALGRSIARGLVCEVDVGLSRDGKAMILHDESLLRTTGTEGLLEDFYESELATLRAARPRFGEETLTAMAREGVLRAPEFSDDGHPDLGVPSLREALALPGGQFMLELKATRTPEALLTAVLSDVARAQAQTRVALASFDATLIDMAEQHAPHLPRIGVAETLSEARDMLRRPISCLAVACAIAAEIRAATPPHIALWCWTVYTPVQAERLRVVGVDGVITDAPAAIDDAFCPGGAPRRMRVRP